MNFLTAMQFIGCHDIERKRSINNKSVIAVDVVVVVEVLMCISSVAEFLADQSC